MEYGKSIDYRNEHRVGDVKYLWELNRHLELPTLAQAWHLTRESRYAEGCRRLLDSWFAECPYPLGLNWTSSLEHGIRLVNWAFAWHLLDGEHSPLFADAQGQAFRRRWLRSIRQHLHFIAGHLSRHSSANNHLLGELMGLFIGAVNWPLWPECQQWRKLAHREFSEQALLQTAPDGVNREQAIFYQHEVMDMMLLCGLMGRANQLDFGAAYWERLERMMEFLAAVMDRDGQLPMIGDADDARIVRFDPSRRGNPNPYRSLLSTGAVLFRRGDFKAQAGVCDDKTRWLLGGGALDEFDSIPPATQLVFPSTFADGGYQVLCARRGEATEILAVFDCGPIGYGSLAAHGHSDALSMTLSAGGIPLLIDPGTYAYHTHNVWRDYFRSTFAHNTICIDGQNQSVSGGNFLWLRKATARRLESWDESGRQRVAGEHDGYCRLSDPVVHRRSIEFDVAANRFTIQDVIDCKGSHRAELCWHISDECDVEVIGSAVLVRARGVRLTMSVAPDEIVPRLFRGISEPPAGWISRKYDVKSPASTVVWSLAVHGPSRFVTILDVQFS